MLRLLVNSDPAGDVPAAIAAGSFASSSTARSNMVVGALKGEAVRRQFREGIPMKIQFDDPLFEAWTQRPMLNIAEAGAEIGEIKATAARIPEGDRDAWYREWTATADRLNAQAGDCAARGARVSARCLYQRASSYYRNAY